MKINWRVVLWLIFSGISAIALAVIGGISGPLYTHYGEEASPNIEIISVDPILVPEDKYGKSCVSDLSGNKLCNSYIDLILLNKGKGVAITNQLDFEIINASLNTTPVIQYDQFIYGNTIRTKIINMGWGPAKEFKYNASLNLGPCISLLGINDSNINWTGEVNPGENLFLNFQCNLQNDFYITDIQEMCDDLICEGNIFSEIKYREESGELKNKNSYENIYLYKINRSRICSNNDMHISLSTAEIIKPVEILYGDPIDPEMICPSMRSFKIHHYLSENQIDEILIELNATRSGKYRLKIRVLYNSEKPVVSKIIDINLIKINKEFNKNIREVHIWN